MTVSNLHQKVINLVGDNGAFLLSKEVLSMIVLDSFEKTVFRMEGISVPTLHSSVIAIFESISVKEKELKIHVIDKDGETKIKVIPEFNFVVSLKYIANTKLEFTKIKFNVSDICLRIIADNSNCYFSLDNPTVLSEFINSPSGSRNEAIEESGIDELDLQRLEGAFAYGSGGRLVTSVFGNMPEIRLNKMFPDFHISGPIKFISIDDNVVVIPENISIPLPIGCVLGDATEGVSVVPQQPKEDSENTRKTDFNINLPTKKVRKPLNADPLLGIHLPKGILSHRFENISPSVSYSDTNNDFIGHKVNITCSIKSIELSIDSKEKGLRLKVGFSLWGVLFANIDLGSLGRQDIARAYIEMPKNNPFSTVELMIRLAVDTKGNLLTTTDIIGMDLGTASVTLELFSKYLSRAGGREYITGIILDEIIARIMAHNIPSLISETLKNNFDKNFFIVSSLSGLQNKIDRLPNNSTFSGNSDYVLLGKIYKG